MRAGEPRRYPRGRLLRRPTALVALVLVVLGAAACGGGDDDDGYADDFQRVSQRIVSLGEEVGQAIETAGESSDRELADQFGGFADELRAMRQDLEELEPPDDLADKHDELVAAIGPVQASLGDIAEAAEQSDPDAARQATIDLVEQSTELRDARRALARAVREQS
jgi:hypothetical protein